MWSVATDEDSSRTLGEIARRLDEVAARFESLANKLDTTYLRRETFTSYRELAVAEHQRLQDAQAAQKELVQEHVKRIADLEEGRKWVARWLFGAVGTAVVTAVFTLAQSGAKP